MKKNKIMIILLFCIILRVISAFPLDNVLLPGGADAASHIFKSWYISEIGLSNWNEYWYGGHLFLRFYPPLFYIISGYLGKIIGYLLAYKFVIDFFYVLTPLAFYYFLDEFNLSEKQKSISLIVFSLIPVYHYYFSDGRHPALISLFFGILSWKFLKRSLKDEKWNKNFVLCSFFLSLCMLTHHLTGFFIVGSIFIWALTYSLNYKTLIKFIKIIFLCSLLTAWWFIPFFLESWTSVKEQRGRLRLIENEFTVQRVTSYLSMMSIYYLNNFSEKLIFSFVFIICGLCLFSLHNRDKITLSFFSVVIFITLLTVFISYRRGLIIIFVPMSILASQGLMFFKNKVRITLMFILIILTFLSYFSLRTYVYDIPETPNIPKDGRVLYLQFPSSDLWGESELLEGYYTVLIGPLQGHEIISGWYPQAIYVGEVGWQKLKYDETLNDPLKVDSNKYYSLLKDGYVNYVVVNKMNNEFVKYFNSSKNYIMRNITGDFILFEVKPKSTYIEINNKSIEASILKNKDRVELKFNCEPGKITIKESYYKFWDGYINDKKVDLSYNDNGFIETNTNENGNCFMLLKFVDPWFYLILKLVFIIGIIFIVMILLKRDNKY